MPRTRSTDFRTERRAPRQAAEHGRYEVEMFSARRASRDGRRGYHSCGVFSEERGVASTEPWRSDSACGVRRHWDIGGISYNGLSDRKEMQTRSSNRSRSITSPSLRSARYTDIPLQRQSTQPPRRQSTPKQRRGNPSAVRNSRTTTAERQEGPSVCRSREVETGSAGSPRRHHRNASRSIIQEVEKHSNVRRSRTHVNRESPGRHASVSQSPSRTKRSASSGGFLENSHHRSTPMREAPQQRTTLHSGWRGSYRRSDGNGTPSQLSETGRYINPDERINRRSRSRRKQQHDGDYSAELDGRQRRSHRSRSTVYDPSRQSARRPSSHHSNGYRHSSGANEPHRPSRSGSARSHGAGFSQGHLRSASPYGSIEVLSVRSDRHRTNAAYRNVSEAGPIGIQTPSRRYSPDPIRKQIMQTKGWIDVMKDKVSEDLRREDQCQSLSKPRVAGNYHSHTGADARQAILLDSCESDTRAATRSRRATERRERHITNGHSGSAVSRSSPKESNHKAAPTMRGREAITGSTTYAKRGAAETAQEASAPILQPLTQAHLHAHATPPTASFCFISFLDGRVFSNTTALCRYNVMIAESLSDEHLDLLREVVFHHDEALFAELLYGDDIHAELGLIESTLGADAAQDTRVYDELLTLQRKAVARYNQKAAAAFDAMNATRSGLVDAVHRAVKGLEREPFSGTELESANLRQVVHDAPY